QRPDLRRINSTQAGNSHVTHAPLSMTYPTARNNRVAAQDHQGFRRTNCSIPSLHRWKILQCRISYELFRRLTGNGPASTTVAQAQDRAPFVEGLAVLPLIHRYGQPRSCDGGCARARRCTADVLSLLPNPIRVACFLNRLSAKSFPEFRPARSPGSHCWFGC